jgi:heme oxygenase
MSNKLKELTWAHHQAAERRKFAKELLSGKIDPKLYHKFLCCQYLNYQVLEKRADIPLYLTPIKRSPHIWADIRELEEEHGFEPPDQYPDSVNAYTDHIEKLYKAGDNQGLIANMYVRHFGELHGGQMIKKRTPGSGRMYEFDMEKEVLIEEFRKLLSDDMAEEAKICFDFASQLFDELSQEMVDNS